MNSGVHSGVGDTDEIVNAAKTTLKRRGYAVDVDLIVPEIKEHNYLTRLLKDLGYKAVTGAGVNKVTVCGPGQGQNGAMYSIRQPFDYPRHKWRGVTQGDSERRGKMEVEVENFF
jgi:hypothetical protein